MPGATCAALILMSREVLKFPLEMRDAVSNPASVCFQFRFTGASRADSSAKARQLRALSGESRQQIPQLRQLHLNLSLPAVCPSSEDIEDQLGTVDHFNVRHL